MTWKETLQLAVLVLILSGGSGLVFLLLIALGKALGLPVR